MAIWQASTVVGMNIHAKDGGIGSIVDLLFDDKSWTIRWAIVDTGEWLPGRQVLLPPSALARPDRAADEIRVDLTRRQVENSPGAERDLPVSRQMEANIYSYYGWSPYWNAAFIPPLGVPMPILKHGDARAAPAPDRPSGDPALRSTRETTGYYIHGTDGDVGHVEEFLVEDSEWDIRYLVVDTKNWWPGRKVLVAPKWVREVLWSEQQVRVELTQAQIKASPEYDPRTSLTREYEDSLHSHYGQQPYWR